MDRACSTDWGEEECIKGTLERERFQGRPRCGRVDNIRIDL
jgi:hypothetical protein